MLHIESLEERSLLAVWLSTAEIMALPAEGPGWETVAAEAERDATPNISNQDSNADVNTLAKALVGTRLGDAELLQEARDQIMAAIGTEDGGRTLALGRNLASYVIAADIVGLDSADDAVFRDWLSDVRHEELSGRTLVSTHEDRPNNWGTMAGASRAAVAAYLGDAADLDATATVFRGYLGDRDAYAGFKYGSLSWQADPDNPVGINPAGAIKDGVSIDGVMPDDMRRGGDFSWPPGGTGYPWEGLQGAIVQAEILHRQGYDAWNWEDQALLRATTFLYDIGWEAEGDDTWQTYLINARYGTSSGEEFGEDPGAYHGKLMGWTSWTHAEAADVDEPAEDPPTEEPPVEEPPVEEPPEEEPPAEEPIEDPPAEPAESVTVEAVADTKLREDLPDRAMGSSQILELDGNPNMATLVRFDISAADAAGELVGAELTFTVRGASADAFNVHAAGQAWSEDTATYNTFDFAAVSEPIGTLAGSAAGQEVTAELNAAGVALVQAWLDSSAESNHGFALFHFADARTDDLDLYSREASDASVRPKLTLHFGEAPEEPIEEPTNQPPLVDAGEDLVVTAGDLIVLTPQCTDDGLPSATLEHTWQLVNGPGYVLVDDPYTLAMSARFYMPGTYTLRLTVTDGELTASDDLTVEVSTAEDGDLQILPRL